MRARQAPAALAIVLKGNPEYLERTQLDSLADKALDEAMQRLAGAAADSGPLGV